MTQAPTKAVLLSANTLLIDDKPKVVEDQPVYIQPNPARRREDETKCFLLKKNNKTTLED